MKKILSMILAFLIAAGSVTAYAVESGDAPVMANGEVVLADGDLQVGDSFIEGDLKYTVLEDGTLRVSCPSENKDKLTDVTIPPSVNGMAVTSIGDRAFANCTSLISVTIPEGVTSIGAFAFDNCTSLASVTIPNSVTWIGGYAFWGCTSLTSVTIPEGVTSIGYGTFYGCTSLTSVTIPQRVTWIGYGTFYGCTSLTSVTIPNSVTEIRNGAFSGCTSLASVKIPEGVTSIGDRAFDGCKGLASVTIPDSVTWIGEYAFDGCKSLTSVTIPEGVTSIDDSAFYDCTSLTAINVDKGNKNYRSENGVLFNKEKTELITYPAGKTDKSYAIPEGITSIGNYAFNYCTSLTSVTIPEGVTSIGAGAFDCCRSLISVTIPEGVTSIGAGAFDLCTSLTSVTLPESVTSIGGSAFWYCTSLTAINVDKGNKNYCSENGVLFNKEKTELITYPARKTDKSYAIPEGVTSIDSFAFENCASLTSVTIPDSVTSISYTAFSSCPDLYDVYYSSSKDQWNSIDIDDYNSALIYANIHYNSFFEGDFAYSELDDGTLELAGFIGDREKVKEVIVPLKVNGKAVTTFGAGAFRDCTNLTSVTIPDSVTEIGYMAFYGCTSLTSVTIPEGVTSIDWSTFRGCTSFTSVTIPDSVTSIGNNAFNGCTSLTSVTIPDSVTKIEYGAFDYCTSLKNVYYSGTEEEWSEINIDNYGNNNPLSTATIHYNSIGPDSVQIEISKPESSNAPDTSDMKIEIAGGGEKPQTITISADGKLDLSGIADGKYSFTFSANNCAPRKYSVTVLNGTASGIDSSVGLHLYGDLDGDGKVNMKDVGKANAHAKNTAKLSGYDLSVSDINGDGKINMQDVGLMNAHAKNTKSLWK